jgi:homoserine dehydrogenase
VKHIPIIQLGVGNVGRSLIEQVLTNRPRHAEWLGLRFEYVALADRDGAVVRPEGLGDSELQTVVAAKMRGARLNELETGYVQNDPAAIVDVAGTDEAIVVDVTATDTTIPALLHGLQQGYRLVLANKLPLTQSFALFQRLTTQRRTRYETTVGAGLPVINALQTLLDAGDEAHQVRGCLSGTVGFICAQLEAAVPFSDAVREAKRRGYTEPDPRDDLAGSDTARKTLILARMLGYPLELEDVEVERLYPSDMDHLSVDEFLARVGELDDIYAERTAEAATTGHPLRYVSEIVDGRCRVSLTTVDPNSRLACIQPSDSIVVFRTRLYDANPLTISGRGAGPVVTAAGVLGDIVAMVT